MSRDPLTPEVPQGTHVMTMLYDHLIQRAQTKRARDQRLDKVRAALAELLPEEKEELLIELLADMNPGDAANGLEPVAEEQHSANGSGQRVYNTKPDGYTVAKAVIDVMRDGKARASGEIISATTAMHTWAKKVSIPAVIARLVTEMDPPLLIKRGKSRLGHPKYVIAPPTETPP